VPAGGLPRTASEPRGCSGCTGGYWVRWRAGCGVPARSGRGEGAFRGVLGAVVLGCFSSILHIAFKIFFLRLHFSIGCLLNIIPCNLGHPKLRLKFEVSRQASSPSLCASVRVVPWADEAEQQLSGLALSGCQISADVRIFRAGLPETHSTDHLSYV